MEDMAGAQPIEQQYLPLRKVLAVGVGNALEFYDFITFSFFAIQIGHCFFPESQTPHGLLFSLASFGVGFLTRPLGGVVIGMYGLRSNGKAGSLTLGSEGPDRYQLDPNCIERVRS